MVQTPEYTTAVEVRSEQPAFLTLIEKMVGSEGFSVEMLEKMLGVQERWEANEARKAYTEALAAFKAAPPSVVKEQQASFGTRQGGQMSYSYASLDTVTRAVIPALAEHGLSHHWTIQQEGNTVTVRCVLTHRRGHSEYVELSAKADDTGQKNPIQQIGSTVSYLERYTLLAATGLAAEGHDDDGHQAYRQTRRPIPAQAQPASGESRDERVALRDEILNLAAANGVSTAQVEDFAREKHDRGLASLNGKELIAILKVFKERWPAQADPATGEVVEAPAPSPGAGEEVLPVPEVCPLHGAAWKKTQDGHRDYHFVGEGAERKFCNPNQGYEAEFEKALARAGYAGREAEVVAQIKEKFGQPWSKLNAAQCCETIAALYDMVPIPMPGLDDSEQVAEGSAQAPA